MVNNETLQSLHCKWEEKKKKKKRQNEKWVKAEKLSSVLEIP